MLSERESVWVVSAVHDSVSSDPATVNFFQAFLEQQSKLLTVQVNALALQSAPPLVTFTGEEVEVEGKSFEKWLVLGCYCTLRQNYSQYNNSKTNYFQYNNSTTKLFSIQQLNDKTMSATSS